MIKQMFIINTRLYVTFSLILGRHLLLVDQYKWMPIKDSSENICANLDVYN